MMQQFNSKFPTICTIFNTNKAAGREASTQGGLIHPSQQYIPVCSLGVIGSTNFCLSSIQDDDQQAREMMTGLLLEGRKRGFQNQCICIYSLIL